MTILEAVERAIQGEEEARSFYEAAAGKTSDAGGAAMFRELAEFEGHHKERLTALRRSLASGGSWIAYEGRSLSKAPAEGGGRKAVGPQADALEALRIAIAAEEKAMAQYREMAGMAGDGLGRQMFERLAEEESMHRRLLNDQYFALSNRGEWMWGD